MNQTSNTYLRNMYSKYEYFDLQPHDGVFFMQLRFEQENAKIILKKVKKLKRFYCSI